MLREAIVAYPAVAKYLDTAGRKAAVLSLYGADRQPSHLPVVHPTSPDNSLSLQPAMTRPPTPSLRRDERAKGDVSRTGRLRGEGRREQSVEALLCASRPVCAPTRHFAFHYILKTIFFGLTFLPLLASAEKPPLSSPHQQEVNRIQHARTLVIQHAYNRALAEYRQIATQATSPEVLVEAKFQAGQILANQGHEGDAIQVLAEALSVQTPDSPRHSQLLRKIRSQYFFALLQMEKYDDAAKFVREGSQQHGSTIKSSSDEIAKMDTLIARWKKEYPDRKIIRREIDRFFDAIKANDIGALSAVLAAEFPSTKLIQVREHLKQHPIAGFQIEAIDVSISTTGLQAISNAYVSLCEKGDVRQEDYPRLFLFKLSKRDGMWKIDSY